MSAATKVAPPPKIWWSNSIFFVSVHLAAIAGVWTRPPTTVPWATLVLAFTVWQLADFGITIGYHRLYSHRAFRAGFGTRLVLAALGSAGFQGSIKWWCLRHRLHHRFTDDPVHDPYAATKGLFYSHMGWIFYKPTYERMEFVDREDLDNDPVVRFQHKYYVMLALFFGFVVPAFLGLLWGDVSGALIYAGLVSRLAIWHCTFLVNSLAHWDGIQPYSDEDTSRGTFLLALLTGGEGNHNFHHAFPHDYRSGPSWMDWDPSKWIIVALHELGCATGLRRARPTDILDAKQYMNTKHSHHGHLVELDDGETSEIWDMQQMRKYIGATAGRCIVLIDGYVVDATSYMSEHPGGASLLRAYSIRTKEGTNGVEKWRDASWAFSGGLNNHSRAAKRRMRDLRIAKLRE